MTTNELQDIVNKLSIVERIGMIRMNFSSQTDIMNWTNVVMGQIAGGDVSTGKKDGNVLRLDKSGGAVGGLRCGGAVGGLR